jgi:hypothetical protein
VSEDSETTLRLERLIPMEPEPLFALWTEPAQAMATRSQPAASIDSSIRRIASASPGPGKAQTAFAATRLR